ncbi:MAG: hypothetical protein WAW86_03895 [Gammaproteobacteria bacterium]
MKQKQFVMTIFAAVMTTYSYADVIPVALYGNTAPLYLADASSSMQQPNIQGRTAGGENQTTVIDSNGNLKIVDKAAEPAASASQGATSNNMSGSNPGNATTSDAQTQTPNAGSNLNTSTPSNMNANVNGSVPGSLPNNAAGVNPGMGPNNPSAMEPGMAPNNLPGATPGMAPNNVPGATPGMAPGVAPAAGR